MAFGVYGGVIGAAVAVGPVVGGVITSGIGWEWIFFVNVPIGIAAVILTLTQVAESRDPERHGRRLARPRDLLRLAVPARLRARPGQRKGLGLDRDRRPVLTASAVLFVVFVIAELAQPRPMLDLEPVPPPGLHRREHRRLLACRPRCSRCSSTSRSTSRTCSATARWRPACASCRSRCCPSSSRRSPGGCRVRVPVRLLLGGGPAAGQRRAARDDRGRRRARAGPTLMPGFVLAGVGHRPDQPAARLDRRRRRAPLAQRHGLGHQQHLPPGRHRDRHRRARRDLPARDHDQDHRRPCMRPQAARQAIAAAHGQLGAGARLRRSAGHRRNGFPRSAHAALLHAYRVGFTDAFTTILADRRA